MEDSENLKSEVIRLSQINTILIDHIMILKSENDVLKNKIGIKNEVNTNDIFMKGINHLVDEVKKNEKGIKPLFNTIDENAYMINSQINTNDNLMKGIKPEFDNISDSNKGIKPDFDEYSILKTGSNAEINSVQEIAPRDLQINNNSANNLGNYIRKFFHHNTKWVKIKNVAKEILLIHNKGFASSDEMRQITGLSKPGFAKHLPTLLRSGLITRQSYKKYVLTELSKNIMNKAFGNGDRSLY